MGGLTTVCPPRSMTIRMGSSKWEGMYTAVPGASCGRLPNAGGMWIGVCGVVVD